MRLTKSMKVSGYSGGGLNLSFTDPVPIAGKGTPANISGDLVQSDMHSSPNSISIDVSFNTHLHPTGCSCLYTHGIAHVYLWGVIHQRKNLSAVCVHR